MAYSDNDEASDAWESEFIPSQEDPLYHVQVQIEEENEIDTAMNENINGCIKSEDYGERVVEVKYTDKEPKIAKLNIKLTPSKKKHKKKKKEKTEKEFDANVTEYKSADENHEYNYKFIGDAVNSEAAIKEENCEPEIELEDIIKMEANDLDFSPEENIDPQMYMDTSSSYHVKYTHTGKSYPCDQCSFSATKKSRLKEHKNVVHNGVIYPCDQCEYVSKRAGNLKQHKAAKHLGVRYPCDLCDYASAQLGNLKQHKAVKHGCESMDTYSIINDGEAPRFPCDQCEYVATQPGNLKTHKESIHLGIKYPCDECDYVATQLGNLKAHKETKHLGIRYPCDQCSHSSTTKGHLKKHIMTVHIGIEYPCDQCELKFKSAKALRFHREAKHEGITYPCESCEYIASTKALLKKHTASRHDGITFSCDLCSYTTSRNEYLKRHKKSKHTDDQDFETRPPIVKNPFLNIEFNSNNPLPNVEILVNDEETCTASADGMIGIEKET